MFVGGTATLVGNNAWAQGQPENQRETVDSSKEAQKDGEEPLYDELVRRFKTKPLSLGLVAQAVADVQFDRPTGGNGFSLANARLSVRGTLDHGFSYVVQAGFTSDPVILDARISYAFSPAFIIDAGMFKAPFSAELLISTPSIDFVNRSQVVSTLAPGRQVGVGFRGQTPSGVLRYRAGIFNGNGRQLSGNDNNAFLYAARLVVVPMLTSGNIEIGGSIAYSEDDLPAFSGTRLLVGGDFRWTYQRLLLSGEAIYADVDFENGSQRQPFGYQATVGYMIRPDRHQVLTRLDVMDFDNPAAARLPFVVLGYNFWPSQPFEIQVNYLVPANDADFGNHQVLVNFQVAF